jgi:cell wall assembly regulator SMI1
MYMPLPENADAVVPKDRRLAHEAIFHDRLLLPRPVSPGTNVITRASEYAAGDILLGKGKRISAERKAALIAAGVRELAVSKRPRICVLVSSYDRCAATVPLESWQTQDACGPYIRTLMQQWGFDVPPVEYVAPPAVAGLTPAERRARTEVYRMQLRDLAGRFDLIIGCGLLATQPSERVGLNALARIDDYSHHSIVSIKQLIASKWGYAASRDRSPCWVERVPVTDAQGRLRGSYGLPHHDRATFLNLPGTLNEVALLMHAVVRRIVDLYEFVDGPGPHWEIGVLARNIECHRQLNALLWAKIVWGERGEPLLDPLPAQEAHRVGALFHADVIVAIPAYRGQLAAGSEVHFLRLDPTREPDIPNRTLPMPIGMPSVNVHSSRSMAEVSLQSPRDVSHSWALLDAWLVSAPDAISIELNPPATDEEIGALERELGVSMPDEFIASLKIHNGQAGSYTGDFAGGEALLDIGGIAKEWGNWRYRVTAGDFDGITSDSDDKVKDDWYNLKWILFAHNDCGDHLCLDLDPAPGGTVGQVIRVWHDDDRRACVAPSFAAWLQHAVASLVDQTDAV